MYKRGGVFDGLREGGVIGQVATVGLVNLSVLIKKGR